MKRIAMGAGALACALVAGCGGTSYYVPTDERLAEVTSLEGRIGERETELASAGLTCTDQCRGTASICDAAVRICEISGELGDPDVDARCERARSTCETARDRVISGCACDATSGGEDDVLPSDSVGDATEMTSGP